MKLNLMLRSTLLAALIALAAPAWAEGPGDYRAEGDGYKGVASILATGKGTWRISWLIGGERYEGTGIGDGKVLAFSFTSKQGNGTVLYAANGTGGYDGVWAFRNDKTVSYEKLIPR